MPNLNRLPEALSQAVIEMKPDDSLNLPANLWCLSGDKGLLVYGSPDSTISTTLELPRSDLEWIQVDAAKGQLLGEFTPVGGKRIDFEFTSKTALWLRTKGHQPGK